MDTTRIEAIGHQIKGALKENPGKLIGDAKLKTDGAAERAAGAAHDTGAAERVAGIDTDRIMGVGRQIAGAAEQGFGSLTGNARLAAEGSAERAIGKAQNEAGSVRDEAIDAAAVEPSAEHVK
jgi:uncharacterized protein YjbJ (UPF0337 family)